MTTDFTNVVNQFKTNTGLFKRITQGIPRDRWFARPGNDSNHLMWVAGHLVVSRALVLKTLGQEWSASWSGLFASGSKLVRLDQYPEAAEVVRAWDEVADKLAAALDGVSAEDLAKPVSAGRAPDFDGKVSGKIAFLSLHETYHVGQMGYLRKWLGYGQAVG
jgi:uncharacterized damage-inducible protein DinB